MSTFLYYQVLMSFTVWSCGSYEWESACEPNTLWAPIGELEETSWVAVVYVAKEYHQWCDFFWHGTAWGKSSSSEPIFLESVAVT